MLSRTFEWYRIVNPKPTKETVDLRIEAARDLAKLLDASTEWGIVLDAVGGVVSGFESGHSQDSPIIQAIVGAIRTHDSAFPQDLAENALELRAIAAIALGQLMFASGDDPDQSAIGIALSLRAGLFLRPATTAKYLREMIDELELQSSRVITTAGDITRRFPHSAKLDAGKSVTEPVDLATAITSIQGLRKSLKALVTQAAIDREELNLLWWMFAGISSTEKELLADLAPGTAAITCGGELGSICLIPHAASIESMARRAFLANRGTIPDQPIETIVADWSASAKNLMVPDEETKKSSFDHPTLFPLSWLAARLLASGGALGWSVEFEQRTKLSTATAIPYTSIAVQALLERVTQRFCFGEAGE